MASDSSCNDCVWYSVHVGGIFFLSSHTSMYMPFVVFSFCYALNHQFKGKEWDMKQHLFSLGQVLHLPNAFWIQFKWLRIEEILPTITNWKISHKIYSAFIDSLSDMGGPSCLFFNVSCLNRTSRCRQRFSRGTDILHKLLRSFCANNWVTLTPFHHWVKLLVLGLTMGLSLDEGKSHKGKL